MVAATQRLDGGPFDKRVVTKSVPFPVSYVADEYCRISAGEQCGRVRRNLQAAGVAEGLRAYARYNLSYSAHRFLRYSRSRS